MRGGMLMNLKYAVGQLLQELKHEFIAS